MQHHFNRNSHTDSNFFYKLQSREYVSSFRNNIYRDNRDYPLDYVSTMSPMMELRGHSGCVNRLDWNSSGDLLASGSDDTTVKIWRPFEYYYNDPNSSSNTNKNGNVSNAKLICNIQTDHIHNLFGVRFIPGTSDRLLCTGSMDKLVQIQSIERQCTIKNYEIHSDRVKDVQITAKHPFIFYSVSEDGTIRRFDIRMEYKQYGGSYLGCLFNKLMHSSTSSNGNVIIKLRDSSASYSLLKGLSINPIRDYEFAIASGDEYVRIFDIRHKTNECIYCVTPPHLNVSKYRFKFNHNQSLRISTSSIHTTFVEYSSDGTQMVVTYHGENVYVFNTKLYDSSYPLYNDYKYNVFCISSLKQKGNDCFNKKAFSLAIQYYHRAIKECNQDNKILHALYCNIAMCLYHRMHFNDLLIAIYFTDKAIQCNRNYVKAYFWKIKILNKISNHQLTLKTVKKALTLFPTNKDIMREYKKLLHKIKNEDKKEEDIKEEEEEEEYNEYEYYQRYTGHCNLKTDIKEATFFGDKYICSGSDDGRCFIWDKISGELVNILCGVDEEVVNTVRRHPHFPMLAMSGIDSTIKIWSPSCIQSTKYTNHHKIPFTNYAQNTKHKTQKRDTNTNTNQTKKKINKVIQQNQENLSNPPSHQIDLSTLLFWANLMNQ